MPLELIGMIGTRLASELGGPNMNIVGGHIEPGFVREFAQAHEAAGFDTVLVGYGSSGPDGMSVASFAASKTDRLKFLIAHRPGFVAPTLAARKFATLDQFTEGRIALHIISGGNDSEQRRDGDWLEHDERYARTDEYLTVMEKVWTGETFDFEGDFYNFQAAHSDVLPFQQPHPPVFFGGMSEAAMAVSAKHADVFMIWGEPLAAIKEQIQRTTKDAAAYGRQPRFSVSFRPILGATEGEAWDKARGYLARIREVRGVPADGPAPRLKPGSVGSQRLMGLAAAGEVHDERLWTAIAEAVGAYGNTTALVGTPQQVADSLLAYYDLGVTTILIRGFDPLNDATEFGRELIPLLRAGVQQRDAVSSPS